MTLNRKTYRALGGAACFAAFAVVAYLFFVRSEARSELGDGGTPYSAGPDHARSEPRRQSAASRPIPSTLPEPQSPQSEAIEAKAIETFSATVIDEDDVPVPDAQIAADGEVIAKSDANGVAKVALGRSVYVAVKNEFLPATFEAPTTSACVVRLLRGETISGRVEDQDGAPIAGAHVRAISGRVSVDAASPVVDGFVINALRRGRTSTTYIREAISDKDGRFLIKGLARAKHAVTVEQFGYVLDAQGTSIGTETPCGDLTLVLRQVLVAIVLIESKCSSGGFHDGLHCRVSCSLPADLMQTIGSTPLVVPPPWREWVANRPWLAGQQTVVEWGIAKKGAQTEERPVDLDATVYSLLGDAAHIRLHFVALQRIAANLCTRVPLFADCPGHGTIEVTCHGRLRANYVSGSMRSNWMQPQKVDGAVQTFEVPRGQVRLFVSSPFLKDEERGEIVTVSTGGITRVDGSAWTRGLGTLTVDVQDDAGHPSNMYLLNVRRVPTRDRGVNLIGAVRGCLTRELAEPGEYAVNLYDGTGALIGSGSTAVRSDEESRFVIPSQ